MSGTLNGRLPGALGAGVGSGVGCAGVGTGVAGVVPAHDHDRGHWEVIRTGRRSDTINQTWLEPFGEAPRIPQSRRQRLFCSRQAFCVTEDQTKSRTFRSLKCQEPHHTQQWCSPTIVYHVCSALVLVKVTKTFLNPRTPEYVAGITSTVNTHVFRHSKNAFL